MIDSSTHPASARRRSTRWIIGIGIACPAIFIGMGIAHLRPTSDLADIMPDHDRRFSDFQSVMQRFGLFDAVYIDVGAATSDAQLPWPDLQDAASATIQTLKNSQQFQHITARFNPVEAGAIRDRLLAALPVLLDQNDLHLIETRLTSESIRREIDLAFREVTSPGGGLATEQFRRDPLGFRNILYEKLERSLTASSAGRISDGWITDTKQQHILIIATPKFSATDTARTPDMLRAIDAAELAATQAGKHDMRLRHTSAHRSTYINQRVIRADMSWMLPATLVIMFGVIGLFMRWRLIFFSLIPSIIGAFAALGLFGWLQPHASMIVFGCGVALIGVSVDYGLHVTFAWLWARDYRSWLAAVRLPILIGALTTVGALQCLIFAEIPGLRQLGAFAGVGLIFAAISAIFALPLILRTLPVSWSKPRTAAKSTMLRFTHWIEHRRLFIFVATIVLLIVSVPGIRHLRFDADLKHMSYLTGRASEDEKYFESTWGRMINAYTLVQAGTLEQSLQVNDAVARTLEQLQQEDRVAKYASAGVVLPSLQTQNQRSDRWHAFWNERLPELRQRLDENAQRMGLSADVFDPFYEMLNRRPPMMSLDDFKGEIWHRLVANQISVTPAGQAMVLTLVRPAIGVSDSDIESQFASRLTTLPKHAAVTMISRGGLAQRLVELIERQSLRLGLLAFAVVAVCLFFVHGRLEPILVTMTPLVISLPLTLGILGWLAVPINLISAIFVVFVFGMGVDYSVFLFSSRQSSFLNNTESSDSTLLAVVTCVLTTVGGFTVLMFARHPVMYSIGVTAAIGLTICFVTAVTWTPLLASLFLNERTTVPSPGLKHLIGGTIGYGIMVVMGVLYLLIRTCWFKLFRRSDHDALSRFARYWAHLTGHIIIAYFPYRSSRRRVVGVTGDEKPAIVVANHLAALDIVYLLSLPWDMVMVVKRWVWRMPLMGLAVRDAGFLLVDGTTPLQEMVDATKAHLDAGRFVAIFPEGTRSTDGRIHRFRSGAFALAEQIGADLIPIRLTNTQHCTPLGTLWIGDHDTMLRVLPRIVLTDADHAAGHLQLARRVRSTIELGMDDDRKICAGGPGQMRRLWSLYRYCGPMVEQYVHWKTKCDPIFRELNQITPATGKILDLGCGYGLMSNLLAMTSPHRTVIGVDFNERKLRIAQHTTRFVANAQYHLADLGSWSIPSAEVVLLIDVLHYWRPEEQQQLLTRAAKAVLPGGCLIFREGCRRKGLAHRLVHAAEVLAVAIGHNPRGNGLCFLPAEQYVAWAQELGLKLASSRDDLGVGSNRLFIFTRDSSQQTDHAS